jgi:hypothetical protein
MIRMRNVEFFNNVYIQFALEAKQEMQMNNRSFLADSYYNNYSSQILSLKRETASSLRAIESNLRSVEGFKQDKEKEAQETASIILNTKEQLEKIEKNLSEYNQNSQANQKLVHYDDYFLDNQIDPKMAKYYEIKSTAKRGWTHIVKIIDYIYIKSKSDNSLESAATE